MKEKYKIAQIGTFDVENYGDLLFPTILKGKFNDMDIDLFSPRGGAKPFEDETYVYSLDILEEKCVEKRYDAIVIGGGDLIRLDDCVSNKYKKSIEVALSIWQLPIILGKKYNIPVVFNSPGVPYRFKNNQKKVIYNILKNADYISVRDEESKLILEECGLDNIVVVPDTVLCVDEILPKDKLKETYNNLKKQEKFPKIKKYITIQHNISNINDSYYIKKMKELINLITEKYNYNVVLIPIGYVHNDIEFLKKLYDKSNDKLFLIKDKLSPVEMLSVFANSSGYVGTSMHGAVTTYAYNNPIMIININKLVKVSGLLNELNLQKNEINDIDELSNLFENNFFNSKFNNKRIKKEINNHFNIIKNIIQTKKSNIIFNYERDILTSFYDELAINRSEILEIFKIYFNYGDGFFEENKKNLKVINDNNNFNFNLKVLNTVKQIRIDPIEGYYIMFDDLKVSLDNKKQDFQIPNLYNINNKNIIMDLDPKIIVDMNNGNNLDVKFKNLKILKYEDFIDIINIYNNNNKNLNDNLKLIENSFSWKITKPLRKIRNKFK